MLFKSNKLYIKDYVTVAVMEMQDAETVEYAKIAPRHEKVNLLIINFIQRATSCA